MKVAIQCESPLLQRSLELFLSAHLSSLRHCNIVVRDHEVFDDESLSLLIGTSSAADLIKPFSKAQLYHALQQKMDGLKHQPVSDQTDISSVSKEEISFDILEQHIEKLTREYQANILKAVRAFYEK